jgi:hypothetical protein
MSGAERARGARAEVAVVNWLRANGFVDARRYLAGDGRQPGDIDAIPGVVIEVKDVARSAWPTWCNQALDEAGPERIAAVVRRTRGVPDVGRWECRWYMEGLVAPVSWRGFVIGTFAEFMAWLADEAAA